MIELKLSEDATTIFVNPRYIVAMVSNGNGSYIWIASDDKRLTNITVSDTVGEICKAIAGAGIL